MCDESTKTKTSRYHVVVFSTASGTSTSSIASASTASAQDLNFSLQNYATDAASHLKKDVSKLDGVGPLDNRPWTD